MSKRKVEIETVNLAEFCAEHQIDRIDFLKLDCEGAEFEILAASADVLKRVRKIALECHPFGLHTAQQMADLLKGHGFTVVREKSLGSEIEMIYGRRP